MKQAEGKAKADTEAAKEMGEEKKSRWKFWKK